jgi:hypothetical protein
MNRYELQLVTFYNPTYPSLIASKSQELIQKMIQSHASFDKKTEFSKAKYVQRKKKK